MAFSLLDNYIRKIIRCFHSFRDLIPTREVLREIKHYVFDGQFPDPKLNAHSKTFGTLPQSIVHEDNEACLKFATMPAKMSSCTKHIAVPCHFFRSKVEDLSVAIHAIDTSRQLGDQFTKGLPTVKFVADRKVLMGW